MKHDVDCEHKLRGARAFPGNTTTTTETRQFLFFGVSGQRSACNTLTIKEKRCTN